MKKVLNSFEVSTFAFYIMRCSFVGITINNLILVAKQDSYMSIIVGFIFGFIPLLLYLFLMNFKKEYTFPQLVEHLFGKISGRIINILLLIFVLCFSIIIYWNLTNLINSQYLSKTPAFVIGFVFIIPTIYLLTKGLHVISKSSVIFFYLAVILFLIPFIGLIFQVNIGNIFPTLSNGAEPIINGSYQYIANNVLPLFLLLAIPKEMIKDDKRFNKRIIIIYCFGCFILFSILFLTITVFGVKLSTIYQYPEFHLLKRVSIVGFIQRIESTLSIQWILDLFIANILTLYFFTSTIIKLYKIESHKGKDAIIVITSIFVLITSNYIFKNNTIGSAFLKDVFPTITYIFFLILPAIVALKAVTTKKLDTN